jgi:fructose-1,6-bisphosphatase/inositol monophosphatase family enzyme
VAPSPEEARRLLCALGDHVRELVVASRGMDMAAVAGATVADTMYAIDRVADDALVHWFEEHWPDVVLVSEGFDEPVVVGARADWTVIVDTIDGTRGLMYDKRPAWCLAAAAPPGGGLADIVAAAMTELPTSKQHVSDQLSAVHGAGLRAERVDGHGHGRGRAALAVRPSAATDLEHSFSGLAKFFLPGKPALAALEAELFRRLGAAQVFDDQYLSTGGQLHELITGRDRFVADLRPLVQDQGLACHPYDVCTAMLLEEAGGVVTDPWGNALAGPLDTVSPIAWVGYANEALAARVGPVLAELVAGLRAG